MPRTPVLGLPYPAASESPDGPAQFKALADALDGADPQASGAFIVGEIRHIAVGAAPPGWLEANGAARSRSTYSRLFAAIGTTFGAGDGTSTFNVPDCRGRMMIGAGQGAGLTGRTMGPGAGVEQYLLTAAQSGMPAHGHSVGAFNTGDDWPDHTHNTAYGGFVVAGSGNVGALGPGATAAMGSSGATARHVHQVPAHNTNNAAGVNASAAHENMPPFVVIPAYIFAGA